jgi:PEP-CTERM motif
MLRASHALSATMLALLAAAAAPAHAVAVANFTGSAGAFSVTGAATDLTLPGAGPDLWQFDITVSGQMGAGDMLKLLLPSSIYTSVSSLTGTVGYSVGYVDPGFPVTPYVSFTDSGSTATSSSFSFTTVMVPTIAVAQFKQPSLTFTPFGGSGQFNLLDIRLTPLTAPVPEPSTYGLMALGLAAIGLRRRAQKA